MCAEIKPRRVAQGREEEVDGVPVGRCTKGCRRSNEDSREPSTVAQSRKGESLMVDADREEVSHDGGAAEGILCTEADRAVPPCREIPYRPPDPVCLQQRLPTELKL